MKENGIKFLRKYEKILAILFLLLLTGICASLAFNRSVWLDESLSLRWSSYPLIKIIKILKPDVHPPLHYLILHIVQLITGGNLLAAKLFCVGGFLVMLIVGYRLLYKEFGVAAFYYYSSFLISLPFMLVKTVEVRMYSWSMAFAVLVGFYLYQLMTKPSYKYWIGFTISALASAYNHYYGLLTMIFVYAILGVFFVIQKNKKEIAHFLLCCLFTIIGYLPWLPTALKQVSKVNNNYWIVNSSLMGYLKELFRIDAFPHSTKIYLIIIVCFTFILLWKYIRTKSVQIYWGIACMVPFWGVMGFGMIYAKIVRPVMIARYLIIPLVLLVLGISSVCKYISNWLVFLLSLFFIIMMLLTYPKAYQAEYDTPTENTLDFFDSHLQKGDLVVSNNDSMNSVMNYYYPQIKIKYSNNYDIKTESFKKIWFLDNKKEIITNQSELEKRGIQIKEIYSEYGLDNVQFTIYYLEKK